MNINESNNSKRVLIIGSGIAGLLTARVLSEQYEEICIIERDTQPQQPAPRAGVPQSFHLHQFIPRGEAIVQRLFPDFVNDIKELGAFELQQATIQMFNPFGALPLGNGEGFTYSRGLLEWAIRQRVQALPNVRILYQHEVIELMATPDRTRVIGAYIRPRGQVEQRIEVQADLVIDTSGRSSRTPRWLSDLGYTLAEDEYVTTGIGYSTRNYRIPPEKRNIALVVIDPHASSGHLSGGVLKAIEDDTWAVCLNSAGDQYPPTDARGFEEGLARLYNPILAEILHDAEPLTEPRGFRLPVCLRHHYEQMKRWPAGLLVLGDALCFFDPIYGQGMTLAAIEVETLATCLQEHKGQPNFEQYVLQRMQDAIAPAWWRSTIEDLRWPGVTHIGPEPLKGVKLLHKYFDLCLRISTQQLNSLAQEGKFEPQYMSYFLMNWLFISPRDVVNPRMLEMYLQHVSPAEKEAILADLREGYNQDLETLLDEAVPPFAFDFGSAAEGENPETMQQEKTTTLL